jgi:hypothetical protein
MEAVMARKKANNAAKRAAEAALPSSSGSKPKKETPAKAAKEHKRRQTHGGGEKPRPAPLGKPPYTTGRKMSEYEQFLALTSPSGPGGSPLPPRGRRPAALRASQTLAQRDTDDDSQGEDGEQDEEEMDALDRQFLSEYDRYQALASPESNIVLGKRARRPVGGLKEAMEIEKGGEGSDV